MVKRMPRWWYAVVVVTACAGDPGSDEDEDDDEDTAADDTGSVVVEDGRLFINEFMASNGSWTLDDDDAEATPDWVELYNASSFDVDLAGFSLTDDLDEPSKAILGPLLLPAGGHLLLFADGEEGSRHLPFKLDADGDALGLYDPEGQPLDRITFGGQLSDAAAGRAPDGGELGLLPEPTPGEPNPTELL